MNIKEVNPANLGFKGPLLLTGFFKVALEQHFFTPSGIFDDALRDLLWSPDDDQQGTSSTKIYIDNKLTPNPKMSNFRPAILIDRGDWKRTRFNQWDREGMGDTVYGDKLDQWGGSHTFTCLTKGPARTEILGHEVATFFEVYGQLLAAQICLSDLQVVSISAPKLLVEDNETYAVIITVTYQHHNRWSLSEARPKIRHIRPLITVQDYGGTIQPKTTLVDIDLN